jgi:hypothetical protein
MQSPEMFGFGCGVFMFVMIGVLEAIRSMSKSGASPDTSRGERASFRQPGHSEARRGLDPGPSADEPKAVYIFHRAEKDSQGVKHV